MNGHEKQRRAVGKHKGRRARNKKICPSSGFLLSGSSETLKPSVAVKSSEGASEETDKTNDRHRPDPAFPMVRAEICTGCGICLDACAVSAIELRNGKAFILEALCRNCGNCIAQCPVRAIR